jgi:hypothetical protein
MAIRRFVEGLVDAGIVETDPQRMASWCLKIRDDSMQSAPLAAVASAWCRRDIEAAAAWLNSLPPSTGKDFAMNKLARELASQYPVHAMAWAVSIVDEGQRANAIGAAMKPWAKQDPAGASQFLATMKAGKDRDEAIRLFTGQLVAVDPVTAMEWAETVSDTRLRQTTMETVADAWLRKDRAAGVKWIEKGLLPKEIADRLLGNGK